MKERPGPHSVTLAAPPELEERAAADAVTMAGPGGPTSGPSPASSQRLLAYVGQTIDNRYVVEQLLGEGGMGVVFLARHKVIDKRVAIKILRSEMATDAEMTERFLNEARAASSIGNAHIVDISDFGRLPDGSTYFVMEYLDGQSLADLMAAHRGGVPTMRITHIAKQIARGLAAAHAVGIVHRDLKPDNVMLVRRAEDKDFVKILDFGIAKVGGESGRLTKAGSVFGTPHYMAPEQAAGLPVDQRTDVYALGVILYEMASGKVPFDADNFMGILTQHMYKKPALIRQIVPQPQEVPPGLEAVVMKCLEKKSELRYASMEQVVADLEKVEQGLVPDALPELMARSGGFNVPVDYFRNVSRPGGPAMVPGTPALAPKRTSVFVMGVIGAISTALVVVGGVVLYSRSQAAPSVEHGGATGASAAVATAPTSATGAAPVSVVAPAPVRVSVKVRPVPEDAVLVDVSGGKHVKLGLGERSVVVEGTATVVVRAEKPGFKPSEVIVDGSAPEVTIELEPARTAPVRGGAKTTPPPQPASKPSAAPPAPATGRCPAGQVFLYGKCENL